MLKGSPKPEKGDVVQTLERSSSCKNGSKNCEMLKRSPKPEKGDVVQTLERSSKLEKFEEK
jgi:hypothetical protein